MPASNAAAPIKSAYFSPILDPDVHMVGIFNEGSVIQILYC